jgi:hypothetical protein
MMMMMMMMICVLVCVCVCATTHARKIDAVGGEMRRKQEDKEATSR